MADLGLFFISMTWALSAMAIKALLSNVDGYFIALLTVFLSMLLFLFLFVIRKERPRLIVDRWIIIGAVGFTVYQVFLNIGLSVGYAHSSIMTYAFETIFIAVYSHFFLKEKLDRVDILSILICIAGICLINFNGITLKESFQSLTLYLFMISGSGVAANTVSNKVLVKKYDTLSYVFSIYVVSFLLLLPIQIINRNSVDFSFLLNPKDCALFLFLGITSGVNVYIFSKLLRKVEFIKAVVLTKSLLIFNILFSRLFFKEMITVKIFFGMMAIAVGMTVLSINEKSKRTSM